MIKTSDHARMHDHALLSIGLIGGYVVLGGVLYAGATLGVASLYALLLVLWSGTLIPLIVLTGKREGKHRTEGQREGGSVAMLPCEPASMPAPPLAPGAPLIGSARVLLADPIALFVRSYLTLGPVFRIKAPTRNYLVLAGPEANRWVMHGGEAYLEHKPLYQHIATQLCTANYPIATDGERHRHLRRSIKAAFSHQALEDTVQPMLQTATAMANQLATGQKVRVLSLLHRMIGDQLGVALLHQPLGEHWRQAITFARFSIGHGLGAYPVFAKHLPRYQLAKQAMLQFLQEIVAWHREHPAGEARPADMIDRLLEMRDHTGQPFNDKDIVANAQMVYSNSLLYAAPAASFLLYALLKHPSVLARVKVEVDELFAKGMPTYQQLMSAPTLRGALLESMRRFPIALATPRVVARPFEFGGYAIAPGERVLIAVAATNFLPECFPNPYMFDPDRFGPGRRAGTYQPQPARYGLGQHSCIGANVADLVVCTSVATLIHYLDLALVNPDYVLRRVVNPFPEPERAFAIRVLGSRFTPTFPEAGQQRMERMQHA